MLNLLEASTPTLEQFLSSGTSLLTWIGTSMVAFLNVLMGHPVTAVFLIIGLVYVVIGIVRRFTR